MISFIYWLILSRISIFIKAIQIAKQITEISDEDVNLIMQARKILLFKECIPWVKKERNEDFVCELVGSYIFQQLSQLFEHHSAGLYRDDGLAILKSLSVQKTERVKKEVIKVFKYCRLKTTIKSNFHIMNFLDITLNLRNNTYEQYRKPDN